MSMDKVEKEEEEVGEMMKRTLEDMGMEEQQEEEEDKDTLTRMVVELLLAILAGCAEEAERAAEDGDIDEKSHSPMTEIHDTM